MIERITDADRINAVINDSAVRPFVGPPELGDLDLTEVVDRPEHWCLFGDHGGFLLAWSAPGIREVHTFILPDGRGAWARDAAAQGIEYARANGTVMLWTKCPPAWPHIERFARQMGMSRTGETIDTFGKPYVILNMELTRCP